MPIIDKVHLQRTPFGHEWADTGPAAVRFVGRAADGRSCSPWPLLEGSQFTTVPRQVHSASVRRVPPQRAPVPVDGLVTRKPGVTLLIVTADCVPLLAYDGRSAIAVHAGWRGIASGAVRRTLRCLDRDRPWSVWLGPHIGRCCYEVSPEVAERVTAASTNRAAVPGPAANPHLDLRSAVLAQAGLRADDRLTIVEGCTQCNADALYSYRRDGAGGGRNMAAISISDSGQCAGAGA